MPISNNVVKEELNYMNNQLTKYNESIWNKMRNKLKKLLWNKNIQDIKTVDALIDNNEIPHINEKYEREKKKFVELITKFSTGKVKETDLTMDEIKILTKYYKQENLKLDKTIEKQKSKINELNLELNRAYEKAIKLKA